jgi:hypothetical protein
MTPAKAMLITNHYESWAWRGRRYAVMLQFQFHFGKPFEVITRHSNASLISPKSSKITKSFVALRWLQNVREGQQILPSRLVFLGTKKHLTKSQAVLPKCWRPSAWQHGATALLVAPSCTPTFYFALWTMWHTVNKYSFNNKRTRPNLCVQFRNLLRDWQKPHITLAETVVGLWATVWTPLHRRFRSTPSLTGMTMQSGRWM